MREQALLDISTINRGSGSGGTPGARLVPALTVISHPLAHRVGDRLLLEALAEGRTVQLSRNAPDFLRPGGGLWLPLNDPGLSRRPLGVGPGSREGAVRLDPGESRQVIIPGAAPQGPWEFSPEQVAAGVVLELAERVVLLLHLADPAVNGAADALGMVGSSVGIQRLRRDIEQVSDLTVPVLVRGETGSGKELIARAIHQSSARREKIFVSVNLGAITKELAAAELFGAARGAFTGAVKDREGFFRAAHEGTLFLDEVGEAPPEVQVMLLRVLETGEIFPVGERTPVKVDVRIIAATDAKLEQQIQEGKFKAPLLHRLAGYEIRVPPLRERREDIGLLFHHFAREELEAINEAWRLKPEDASAEPWLPAGLASRLVRHGWPGNIRQLRNLTRQLIIGSRGQPRLMIEPWLERALGDSEAAPTSAPAVRAAPPEVKVPSRRKLSDFTEEQIVAALEANHWEIKKATELLGVARSSLYDWLERSPHVRLASRLSTEELTRCFQELQGDLDAMSRHLKLSRWAISRRLKELGLLQDAAP